MNVFVAFPQATPASKFPTCTSDYYHFSELLTPEEQAVRKRVREFMEKEVAPIMTEAEFPFHIIPKLGALGVVGGSIKVMAVLATSQPMPLQQQRYLALMQAIVEFLGTGEVVRIKTPNGWCLPMDSLPSHVHCAITPAQLGDLNNNITDDLEVTLTITYYNQNATARLDVDLIITDLEPPTIEEENDACIVCFENYNNGTYLCSFFILSISAALINGFVQT
ncbi:hypothetical protein HID58_035245 [Brassica napus]|uniref:Acyl-CoA dehydrogenase/oxidase N-terminal domain-containing protein n=1 Tax=Brassica napus TaxID=3708 RepID=A0ABQ8C4D7_BRANA|nr:hypothetical protein HID58_035245 [Brassica napus]